MSEAARRASRIVLVGFMGSGKTTVGAELARLLGWDFLDLDASIERRAGRSIAEIFREGGETAFRNEEREAAREAAGLSRCVLASGGGGFADPQTRPVLRSGAVCVYLRCDFARVAERAPADGSRPLAQNRETMRALYDAREPSYRLAELTVDTTDTTPEAAAREVLRALERTGAALDR